MRQPVLLVLAAAVLTASAPTTARAAEDPSCGEWRIPVAANTVIYALPRTYLRAGSDSVWIGEAALESGRDFTLDPLRGELRLLRTPLVGDTLRVRACALLRPPPLSVQPIPYRAAVDDPPDTAAVAPKALTPRPATARAPGETPSGIGITLSGNKTLAVDFGSNQDAFLRQSLDLTVGGTIAPGVELTAVLSDQSVPITESGATQSIENVDRVLLELRSAQGGAALGDIALDWDRGEFGRIERRLQGVRADWRTGTFDAAGAAATQTGEFRRIQFYGVEGSQGPYLLSDAQGRTGVAVVAGSEVVTIDGTRMNRGESADYSIEYERGRITFTNRRPISSETRITVDYQVATSAYRRNLAGAGAGWTQGSWNAFARVLREADDRGRPLEVTFDETDRVRLALAGDSASRAVGTGVANGGGDYDTIRVSSGLIYSYVGGRTGDFDVQFANVGFGQGDYAESTLVDGRRTYRFVGTGIGTFLIGRPLPLPGAHDLITIGTGFTKGGLTLEVEGATSRFDQNTFSSRDDGDNAGFAGRAQLRATRDLRSWAGVVGVGANLRAIESRFQAFSPLERPFAEESWGLPLGSDLEHQKRAEGSVFWQPRGGGELRATAAGLRTEDGYQGLRRDVVWAREGRISTLAAWERADGEQTELAYSDGGRERARAQVGLNGRWLAPLVRAEQDERWTPSDTGRVAVRVREGALALATGSGIPWRASAGVTLRRDARAAGESFADQAEVRTGNLGLESPADRPLRIALRYQRREVEPFDTGSRSRADLGGARISAERSGARGDLGTEITNEGESRRERTLVFVGSGLGSYDALGNFVGTGDYDLRIVTLPDIEQAARAATTGSLILPIGRGDAWRGTRGELGYESDVRRRGALRAPDLMISPDALYDDPGIARGVVLQRVIFDVAPGSRAAAVLARIERRVTVDRSFANFAQRLDDRSASGRWRGRPSPQFAVELEARARRRAADQELIGGGAYHRVLEEQGGVMQAVFTAGSRLRAAGVVDVNWSRPEGEDERSRTLRVGPDLGAAVGQRGRLELSARRIIHSGATAVDLLPTPDPLALLRWEGTARFDYRLHSSTTAGVSLQARDRADRGAQVTGRAEVRAFF
jgi:hypothetical protein